MRLHLQALYVTSAIRLHATDMQASRLLIVHHSSAMHHSSKSILTFRFAHSNCLHNALLHALPAWLRHASGQRCLDHKITLNSTCHTDWVALAKHIGQRPPSTSDTSTQTHRTAHTKHKQTYTILHRNLIANSQHAEHPLICISTVAHRIFSKSARAKQAAASCTNCVRTCDLVGIAALAYLDTFQTAF